MLPVRSATPFAAVPPDDLAVGLIAVGRGPGSRARTMPAAVVCNVGASFVGSSDRRCSPPKEAREDSVATEVVIDVVCARPHRGIGQPERFDDRGLAGYVVYCLRHVRQRRVQARNVWGISRVGVVLPVQFLSQLPRQAHAAVARPARPDDWENALSLQLSRQLFELREHRWTEIDRSVEVLLEGLDLAWLVRPYRHSSKPAT
jgi:hypothetical protein